MNTVRLNAYAKLNLTLDLTGEDGGYHMLDSLVCSVDLFDRLVLRRRRDRLVNVYMHGMGSEGIPPEKNHAVRAAEAFVETFATQGADVHIYKNIPIGAGMGGSSADAAGVLNGMAKLYSVKDAEKIKALADGIGSDAGYMLTGGFARLGGRGDLVQPLTVCPRLYFFLLVPKGGVSTKQCYRLSDETPRERAPRTQSAIDALSAGDAAALGRAMGNDLYAAARQLNAGTERALAEAAEFSPLGVTMTGSGSAVCALFPTLELCQWAKSRYRGKARAYVLSTVVPKERKAWRNPFFLSEEECNL